MITLAWEYLLGRLVASDSTNRDLPEWPPHPDRVFQALVASWGAMGEPKEERAALEWLESLEPPQLHVEPQAAPDRRPGLTSFVPVNDAAIILSKKNPPLRDLPVGRNRQPRTFARCTVHGACYLSWPAATSQDATRHLPALVRLCLATPSLGHSSSLVRMWATADPPPAGLDVHAPSNETKDGYLRVAAAGRLRSLKASHDHSERPATSGWQGYRRLAPDGTPALLHTAFSPELIILKAVGPNARRYGLAHGAALADALRKTLMDQAPDGSLAMELVSGHRADGDRLEESHCAFIPLPFVGSDFADGHLLGMAMVLPTHVSREDATECRRALAKALDENLHLQLRLGKDGTLDLQAVDLSETRENMQATTWCSRDGAQLWATVTPIVLDMMPPRRHEDRDAFALEQVRLACARVDLPAPSQITTSSVSAFVGAPHCRDFPPMHRKPDGARRWHVHAVLSWDKPVRGPVLLGAGRFRGMGLLRPLERTTDGRRT